MSVIFKAKLKNAKTAINDKDYSYSYDLCHDLLELDSTNYNVHILLGVSCQHLQKWNEGTAVYRKAQALGKANILAWQGLCALHEAEGNDQELVRSLGSLRDRYLNQEDDLEKAWERIKKSSPWRRSPAASGRWCELRLLTEDSGPLHRLLLAGNAQDIMTEREVLQRMFAEESALDARTVDAEVAKRRTRLAAGPLAKVMRDVRMEVWAQSGVLQTLARLIVLSLDADERLRWEEEYFAQLRLRTGHLALGGLGAVMLSEGDAAGAAACLERAVALAPGHAAHHARLGWALWQPAGPPDGQARGVCELAGGGAAGPGDASAFGGLALWYAQAGDAAREQRCLEKAVALDAANGAAGERLAAVAGGGRGGGRAHAVSGVGAGAVGVHVGCARRRRRAVCGRGGAGAPRVRGRGGCRAAAVPARHAARGGRRARWRARRAAVCAGRARGQPAHSGGRVAGARGGRVGCAGPGVLRAARAAAPGGARGRGQRAVRAAGRGRPLCARGRAAGRAQLWRAPAAGHRGDVGRRRGAGAARAYRGHACFARRPGPAGHRVGGAGAAVPAPRRRRPGHAAVCARAGGGPGEPRARLGAALAAELAQRPCVDLFDACLQTADAARAVADYCFAKHVWLALVRRQRARGGGGGGSLVQRSQGARSMAERSRLAMALFAARRFVARAPDAGGEGALLLGLLLELNCEWEAAAEAYAVFVGKCAAEGRAPNHKALGTIRGSVRRLRGGGGGGGRRPAPAPAPAPAPQTALAGHEAEPVGDDGHVRAFFFTLGRSLALFFAGRLEESLGYFELALGMAEQRPAVSPQRGYVAVMLAQVLWALGSEDHRGLARQHLLEVVSERASLPGLTTLFAIGLLQGDGQLVAATHVELLQCRNMDSIMRSRGSSRIFA
ncbi:hypothetical protein BX661DRAFT_171709 [Kickxella alabastrina]|uniref:uncharacterized protein n=1 Tax=Kickxella alabastrina TaxID=61397 RepID=UPI00221FB4FD|nr:uncharacterized protein BX661DRAFT_171709 [Kickxella alabastrina]KAI7826452.1 hypothetical protein BX661DRAFT_171709 [Kickxella alabastrina]